MNKERKCRTCAWWDYCIIDTARKPGEGWSVDGNCHHECESRTKNEDDWCRHWSETTGWDVFEIETTESYSQTTLPSKQLDNMKGLLRLAAELFEKDIRILYEQFTSGKGDPVDGTDYGVREKWLEEYRTKC